jgi:hypothetical protein
MGRGSLGSCSEVLLLFLGFGGLGLLDVAFVDVDVDVDDGASEGVEDGCDWA